MKTIEVVAAIIMEGEKILSTQRGYGDYKGWWEFPGGKMEDKETPQAALVREIKEELDAKIEVGELFETVEYDYPNFHLTMHCFLCKLISSEFTLREHEAVKWLKKDELDSVNWLPADLGVVDRLKEVNKMNNDNDRNNDNNEVSQDNLAVKSTFDMIYDIVKQIPYGQVATYGQIAELAGNKRWARVVGYALHANPEPDTIPCYRVVNQKGEVSKAFAFGGENRQIELLEAEGVEFIDGRVDMERFAWEMRSY